MMFRRCALDRRIPKEIISLQLDQVVYDLTIRNMKPPDEVVESVYSGRDIPEPPEPGAETEQ